MERLASVWLVPSQASTTAISHLMRDLDHGHPSWPRFAPHLTLDSSLSHLDDLVRGLPKYLSGLGPFAAQVTGVEWTVERFKTVFLTFDSAHPSLIAARKAILRATQRAPNNNDYTFKPHVSLVYCTLEELPPHARAEMAESCLGKLFEVEFDRAVVVSPRNGVSWEVVSDWEIVAECSL